MKHLIEFPLASGEKAVVETVIPDEFGIQLVSKAGEILSKATKTLEDAIQDLKPAIQAIVNGLSDCANNVDQTEVEFGIKVGASSELIFASTDAEANLKVKLTWKSK